MTEHRTEEAKQYDQKPLLERVEKEREEERKKRQQHYEKNPQERRKIVEELEIRDKKTGEKRKVKNERFETILEMGKRLGWSRQELKEAWEVEQRRKGIEYGRRRRY